MEADVIKMRSSIKTSLMRRTLMRGTFLALLGVSILLYAGIVMPKETLGTWGFPLLLISGGLITWGLLPYRKMTRLEKKPDELVLTETHLIFLRNGKSPITIPRQDIERISYLDRGTIYGIGIKLKSNQGLFFPFFSENSAKKMLDVIKI